ncbi:hypothetical protein GQ457_17G026630 [Hibiscus cannabinus]
MAQNKQYSLAVPQDATVQIIVNGGHWPNGQAPPILQAPPPAPPQFPIPPHGPNMGIPAGSPPRYFVFHPIYKENAALMVEPRSPEFVPLNSASFVISNQGFLLLHFAPAAGVRQNDWGRKQVFSLSVTEIGTLISLGTEESCEFSHFDAYNITRDEAKGRQVLKIEPLPDGSGHLFNLRVENKLLNIDESIQIPITRAEFTVLKSAFSVR